MVEPDIYSEPEEKLDELWEEMMHITLVEDLRTNVDGFIQMCTNPLSDEALIEKLESMKFDLAIADTFVCSRYVQSTPLNSHPVNWHFPFNSDSSSVHNYNILCELSEIDCTLLSFCMVTTRNLWCHWHPLFWTSDHSVGFDHIACVTAEQHWPFYE